MRIATLANPADRQSVTHSVSKILWHHFHFVHYLKYFQSIFIYMVGFNFDGDDLQVSSLPGSLIILSARHYLHTRPLTLPVIVIAAVLKNHSQEYKINFSLLVSRNTTVLVISVWRPRVKFNLSWGPRQSQLLLLRWDSWKYLKNHQSLTRECHLPASTITFRTKTDKCFVRPKNQFDIFWIKTFYSPKTS